MDNNDKALLEEEMKERLEKAVKARLKKEKAEANLKALEQKENDAKEAVKEAKKNRKEAEEKAKSLQNERATYVALAGYKKESPTTRKILFGSCLNQILYMFDGVDKDGKPVKNGDFRKKLNQLRAGDIYTAVLASVEYTPLKMYPEQQEENLRINCKKLREEINKLLAKKEQDIKEAEKYLNENFADFVKKLEEEDDVSKSKKAKKKKVKSEDATEENKVEEVQEQDKNVN